VKYPHPKTYGRNIWKTKEGVKLQWSHMEEDHLINSYHMLRRRADELYTKAAAFRVTGDAGWANVLLKVRDKTTATADDMKRYIEWRVTQQESEE
jgi:hypothetical protein